MLAEPKAYKAKDDHPNCINEECEADYEGSSELLAAAGDTVPRPAVALTPSGLPAPTAAHNYYASDAGGSAT